mmetsp:Transcript_2276/g.6674  ORF Transcript_2276/g.6674 Transcript_2276/m.6674 type:complete len:311 (+) Transcript_2276:791-1723(+)
MNRGCSCGCAGPLSEKAFCISVSSRLLKQREERHCFSFTAAAWASSRESSETVTSNRRGLDCSEGSSCPGTLGASCNMERRRPGGSVEGTVSTSIASCPASPNTAFDTACFSHSSTFAPSGTFSKSRTTSTENRSRPPLPFSGSTATSGASVAWLSTSPAVISHSSHSFEDRSSSSAGSAAVLAFSAGAIVSKWNVCRTASAVTPSVTVKLKAGTLAHQGSPECTKVTFPLLMSVCVKVNWGVWACPTQIMPPMTPLTTNSRESGEMPGAFTDSLLGEIVTVSSIDMLIGLISMDIGMSATGSTSSRNRR